MEAEKEKVLGELKQVRNVRDNPALLQDTLLCLLKTHADRGAVTAEVVARVLGRIA